MSLGVLLRDWLARLARLGGDAADPLPGREWLTAVRIRILRFLITRYAGALDKPESDSDAATAQPAQRPPTTYCIVDHPEDHPPRRAHDLTRLLEHIRTLNAPSPAWWRSLLHWWRARQWPNGDAPAR